MGWILGPTNDKSLQTTNYKTRNGRGKCSVTDRCQTFLSLLAIFVCGHTSACKAFQVKQLVASILFLKTQATSARYRILLSRVVFDSFCLEC